MGADESGQSRVSSRDTWGEGCRDGGEQSTEGGSMVAHSSAGQGSVSGKSEETGCMRQGGGAASGT